MASWLSRPRLHRTGRRAPPLAARPGARGQISTPGRRARRAGKRRHDPRWRAGYRVLAFIGLDGVRLRSRRGLELAAKFPRLADELAAQASGGMILDGELVIASSPSSDWTACASARGAAWSSRPNFHAWQTSSPRRQAAA